MVNITLSVSEDLKRGMDESKEINWAEVARAAIKNKISHRKFLGLNARVNSDILIRNLP